MKAYHATFMDCASKGHWKETSVELMPLTQALKLFSDNKASY